MNVLRRIVCDPRVNAIHFCTNISVRCMAGHAKWQNIKVIKAENDRKKTLICNKIVYLIGVAVREGGGRDPKLNHRLASVIEEAKKNNVPMATIENALKRDNKKVTFGSIEIFGPGGCIIIVEYESGNVSSMRHDIKVLCKKYGANVMSGEGRWRAAYEQKGIIKATSLKNGQPLDAEIALDDAILAGAEEVHTREDEKPYLEFLCAPADLHLVKKEIEKDYEVEEGYIGYLPIATVQLSKDDVTLMDNLLEELGDISDIVRIYENVQ